MALYEHIYLARQDVTAQQVETLTENLKALIAAQGGSVSKVEAWGLKSLAYRIKKNRKAFFTLMNVDAPSAQRGCHPLHHGARRRARGWPLRHVAQARRRRARRSRRLRRPASATGRSPRPSAPSPAR
jgi:ribosomal protein S6